MKEMKKRFANVIFRDDQIMTLDRDITAENPEDTIVYRNP